MPDGGKSIAELTDTEINAAIERGHIAQQTEPRADAVRYDKQNSRIIVDLMNGCTFAFPPRVAQGLETATDEDLSAVEILGAPNGWHIAFSLAIEQEAPTNIAPAVGVDRGVANTLTLSTGEHLSVPASLGDLAGRQRRAQRVLSRRKRGSRRYAKARRRVAALSARRARIRRDWHHKTGLDLSRRFGTVVMENLNTRNMTGSARRTIEEPGVKVWQKSGLNRSILNQGWHLFETLLAYKMEERGGTLAKVPARNTSRTCFACGAVDSRSRKNQAGFVRTTCGHRDHADINAAKVILRRNTACMLVEERYWPSGEAKTIGEAKRLTGNPRPSGRGRC